MMRRVRVSPFLAMSVLALTGCMESEDVAAVGQSVGQECSRETTVSADFESGNIGEVQKLGESEWVLSLPDDNDNPNLPDNFRTWWYVRFDDVSTAAPMSITVGNNVWPYYYVPVYSYDQRNWRRFEESEVTQPDATSTKVVKRFERSTVWLARFYPYTLTDLDRYLDRLRGNPFVTREVVGQSQQGRPMEVLTITNGAVDQAGKKRIWLHGRSHPAETGSSFVLEGFIDFLLSRDPDARALLANFVFSIMPMHNVDGVVVGNYRTTPASQNLENTWLRDPVDPWLLRPESPHEVQVLRDAMVATMEAPGAIPVTMALNLHSSNSEPDTGAFFFPHFGPEELGYTPEQAQLYHESVAFTDAVESFYAGRIEPRPLDGGPGFASNNFPESWWWHNFGADVMAITLETVYGRAGFAPRWVTPRDMRGLGRAVALGVLEYHGIPVQAPPVEVQSVAAAAAPVLIYPDLYPPAMETVLKAQ